MRPKPKNAAIFLTHDHNDIAAAVILLRQETACREGATRRGWAVTGCYLAAPGDGEERRDLAHRIVDGEHDGVVVFDLPGYMRPVGLRGVNPADITIYSSVPVLVARTEEILQHAGVWEARKGWRAVLEGAETKTSSKRMRDWYECRLKAGRVHRDTSGRFTRPPGEGEDG